MKKLIFALVLLTTFVGCKKDDDDDSTPTPVDPISEVPSTFEQKVLIEKFVAVNKDLSPDADYKMDQLIENNNGKIIGVSIHSADIMEYGTLNSTLNSTFSQAAVLPYGMVNRIPSTQDGKVRMNRNYWAANAALDLVKIATCGVAIETSIDGDSATVIAHAGFLQAITGTYKLTIYLLEDSVTDNPSTSYDQANTYNDSATSPFYMKGNPIIGYKHNYVVRKALTADMGDLIPTANIIVGGEYELKKRVNISTYNKDYLRIVAFINKIGSSSTTHEVMNCQMVKLGDNKDWDK